jgi:hypothetical protein
MAVWPAGHAPHGRDSEAGSAYCGGRTGYGSSLRSGQTSQAQPEVPLPGPPRAASASPGAGPRMRHFGVWCAACCLWWAAAQQTAAQGTAQTYLPESATEAIIVNPALAHSGGALTTCRLVSYGDEGDPDCICTDETGANWVLTGLGQGSVGSGTGGADRIEFGLCFAVHAPRATFLATGTDDETGLVLADHVVYGSNCTEHWNLEDHRNHTRSRDCATWADTHPYFGPGRCGSGELPPGQQAGPYAGAAIPGPRAIRYRDTCACPSLHTTHKTETVCTWRISQGGLCVRTHPSR